MPTNLICIGIGIAIGVVVMLVAYVLYSEEDDFRCKDCEHWDREKGKRYMFPLQGYCKMYDGFSDAYDYCAWGERKEGDE